MDPLSITASIITVIDAAKRLLSICNSYKAALRGPSPADAIVQQLSDLQNILEQLLRRCQEFEDRKKSSNPALNDAYRRMVKDIELIRATIQSTNTYLRTLETEMALPNFVESAGDSARSLYRRLTWPLKEEQTLKTIQRLTDAKTSINLALSSIQISMTVDSQYMLSELSTLTQAMSSGLDRKERFKAILAHPGAFQMGDVIAQNTRKRAPLTAQWILAEAHYEQWLDTAGSEISIKSIMGSGKTMLASSVVESLCKENRRVAWYFFDQNRQDASSHSAEYLLHTFVSQLLINDQHVQLNSLDLLNHRLIMPFGTSMFTLLVDALKDLIDYHKEIFLILDAIEDCLAINELFTVLKMILESHSHKIHLFTVFRDTFPLEEVLPEVVPQFRRLIKIFSYQEYEPFSEDIKRYIEHRLGNDVKLLRWSKNYTLRSLIIQKLTEKADGMFQWVECQLDSLSSCMNQSSVVRALNTVPSGLEPLYEIFFRQGQTQHDIEFRHLIKWLVAKKTYVTVEELAETLTLDQAQAPPSVDLTRRLVSCGDALVLASIFVRVEQGAARLSHASVREWLASTRQGDIFNTAETVVLKTCLAYLLHCSKQCNSIWNPAQRDYPLLKYSQVFWAAHAASLGTKCYTNDIRQIFLKLYRFSDAPDDIKLATRRRWILDHQKGRPLLWRLAEVGAYDLLRVLCDEEPDVNVHVSHEGVSAIAIAIKNHYYDVASLLIRNGAIIPGAYRGRQRMKGKTKANTSDTRDEGESHADGLVESSPITEVMSDTDQSNASDVYEDAREEPPAYAP